MILKKRNTYEFDIVKYAFEGKGIAEVQIDGDQERNGAFKVFVQGAYPGDKVMAQVRKKKKNYAEAKTTEVIEASPDRIKPECDYFENCGGCKQQDLKYEKQIEYKQLQVKEVFERIGGIKNIEPLPVVKAPDIFFYRNKMEYSFAERRWLTEEEIASGEKFEMVFAVGLHPPGAFDKVIDIKKCWLQSEVSNNILNFTRSFFTEKEMPAYSTKTHSGYLRHLVIRHGTNTGDLMVNLVTRHEEPELMQEYKDALIAQFPEITTIVNNINEKKAAVAFGDYEIILFGPGYITDIIGDKRFRISANSFFQTNTKQAENLYRTALEFASFEKDDVVYDLYCGAGTISIYVSDYVKEVIGFEAVESAVNDARVNNELNNASNTQYYKANLYKTFLPVIEQNSLPAPDKIIIDPPRGGMHQHTVDDVIALSPGTIVYVSCNPATQARDIKLFAEAGYRVEKYRPVDMFPHTYHIENVALLIKE